MLDQSAVLEAVRAVAATLTAYSPLARGHLEVLSMPPLQGEDTAAIDQLPKDQRVIDPPFAPDWD